MIKSIRIMLNVLLVAGILTAISGCSDLQHIDENTTISYVEVFDKETFSKDNFTLFELFTSESCYDCPPAQDAFKEFMDKHYEQNNILCISEHVDYWNSLVWGEGDCKGIWVDQNADGYYASRQFQYATKLSTGAGTPQVVANGKKIVSDPKLEDYEDMLGKQTKKQAFHIDINLNENAFDDEGILHVDFRTAIDTSNVKHKSAKYSLFVFLLQNKVETTPTVAENCGKNLVSHFVARSHAMSTIRKHDQGTLALNIPDNLSLENCRVVAFVQEWQNLDILAASRGFGLKKAEYIE